ncbi:MAG: hypothetical protein RMI94_07005 [Bryobacterales bacterium]|nr:hypothetical protein [Bryobacteraceae bacterium]MDW8130281.1 hypothetical protein [Bryobacterales bacterium]
MNRNSETPGTFAALLARPGPSARAGRADLRLRARILLGSLLAANLALALAIFQPWGGSADDLERRLAALRQEVTERRQAVERLRAVATKVQTARQQAERFVAEYFLDRRTVSSTILRELDTLAREAGMRAREGSYLFEPIEGSDGLSMMTIQAGFEGSYADLMRLLNLLDRSPRLIILADLQAAPQPSGTLLNVTMKLNAFVREKDRQATLPARAEAPQS